MFKTGPGRQAFTLYCDCHTHFVGACPTHPVNRLPEQLDLAVAALDKDDGGGPLVQATFLEAASLWQELVEAG